MTEIDINIPRMVHNPEILKISDTCFISVTEYEKRSNNFHDVIFNNNGKEIFIGRFSKEESMLKVLYKDGKILVGCVDFVKEINSIAMTKVYLVYDILDDIIYSVNEVEALKLFDPTLNRNYVKQDEHLTIRSDVEKRYRLKRN